MAIICPTVMGSSDREFREAVERVADFAERIHVDFADGIFAPTKLIPIEDAWWPVGPIVDFHIMYKKPLDHLEDVIVHQPHLAIIHAEAEDAEVFIDELEGLGIKRGIAILKDTPVAKIKPYLDKLEHVLVFSGELGHYGGSVDFGLLDKVTELKKLRPSLEIGWDGGIHADVTARLAAGGVDVLNVGGAIQRAQNPEDAYDTLVASIKLNTKI